MRKPNLAAILLLLLLPASCSFILDFDSLAGDPAQDSGLGGAAGASGNAGSDAGKDAVAEAKPGVPLNQVSAVVAGALCDKMLECFGAAAMKLVFFDEDCDTLLEKTLQNGVVQNIEDSIKDGTISYVPENAPACVQAFKNLSCDQVTIEFPNECKAALSGLKQTSQPCKHSLECANGLYCDLKQCPGSMCKPYVLEGAACTDVDECEAGTSCFQGKCTALGKDGEACGGGVLNGCVVGLLCIGEDQSTSQPGKCWPAKNTFTHVPPQGCNFSDPQLCDLGSSCPFIGGACKDAAVSGGSCTLALPDMCPSGEYCKLGAPSACAALPKNGEPCASGLILKPNCQAYNRCVNGSCRAMGANGNTCVDDKECYSGFCDSAAGGFCAPPHCASGD